MNWVWAALAIVAVFEVLLGIAVYGLAQQIGVLHVRLGPVGARVVDQGPALGSLMTPEIFRDVRGRPLRLGTGGPNPRILAFLAPGCSSCKRLMPSLHTFGMDHRDIEIYVMVMDEEQEAVDSFTAEYEDPRSGVRFAHGALLPPEVQPIGTPFLCVLDRNGYVVNKGVANTYEHLESLISEDEIMRVRAERQTIDGPVYAQASDRAGHD